MESGTGVSASANQDRYYFKVSVREGEPGWADYDDITKGPFEALEGAYEALALFNPYKRWRYLRRVTGRQIWREGHPKVDVYTDRCLIAVNNLSKLGVTRKDFDDMIDSIHSNHGGL